MQFKMAFFNLTHTGPQNPFQTALPSATETGPTVPSPPPEESQGKRDVDRQTVAMSDCDKEKEEEGQEMRGDSAPKDSHPGGSPSAGSTAGSWHHGSYTKYTDLLRKHQRNPKGPTDQYNHTLTTSQMYGWWMKDSHDSPQKKEWAQCERHAHVNSQMTRFVDEMSLTNKEFSLY